MTTCQRCKTENLDGSQYCDECGAPIGDAALRLKKSFDTSGTGEPTDESEKDSANARWNGQAGASQGKETQLKYKGMGQALATETVHAKLVIERGRSAGKHFPLCEEESQIGRWDADGGIFPDVDLDADDPEAKVSRRHARIILRGGQYFIEDLGSTNGTFINRGRRLLPGDRQALLDGDEIIVGKTFLRFHVAK
jgi:hypothetical protein